MSISAGSWINYPVTALWVEIAPVNGDVIEVKIHAKEVHAVTDDRGNTYRRQTKAHWSAYGVPPGPTKICVSGYGVTQIEAETI